MKRRLFALCVAAALIPVAAILYLALTGIGAILALTDTARKDSLKYL